MHDSRQFVKSGELNNNHEMLNKLIRDINAQTHLHTSQMLSTSVDWYLSINKKSAFQ